MRVRKVAWALAVFAGTVALVASPRPVRAADPSTTDAFDLQLFKPSIDSKGYITVNASQVLGLWDFSIGLVGTVAGQPLKLQTDDGRSFNYGVLLTPSLQAALGFKYAELAVTVPAMIGTGSREPRFVTAAGGAQDLSFSGQGVGDLGIHVKGRFLNTSKHPVGLALLASVYIPVMPSTSRAFLSDGRVGIVPTIIVDKEFGRQRRFRMALNLGAKIRIGGQNTFVDGGQDVTDANSMNTFCAPSASGMGLPLGSPDCGTQLSRSLGHQLTYGLGASYAVIKEKFDVLGEIYGALGLDGAAASYPAELIVGGKVYLAKSSFFSFGGGTGAFAVGQTQAALWRAFVGFVFEPAIGDKDGDGLKDDVDKCPADPEDLDDFLDTDGCPEPDNDRDGKKDTEDKCPLEPETKNGLADEDGCPDQVELDRDGDGIADSKDGCADDPEDKDAFEDEDGCPDPDNDQDLVLDIDDSCPNDPEDRDGFEDVEGCPDPDNDKDRLLDVVDKCPNEPETYNGYEDEDGCPDKGRVIVRRGKIEILDKIFFETDKAIIKEISFPLLNAIAATLKGNPQIGLVEVQGHADERSDDQHNMELTEARAQSVRQYLVEHGVEAERLQAHGYGETKPVCKEHNEDCWSKNRRVEFVILKRVEEE